MNATQIIREQGEQLAREEGRRAGQAGRPLDTGKTLDPAYGLAYIAGWREGLATLTSAELRVMVPAP